MTPPVPQAYPDLTPPCDARPLAQEAATALASALIQLQAPRSPGGREQGRTLLERAIDLGHRALAASIETGVDSEATSRARATLVKAHAARAEDARQGANQMSMASQRAPTPEDCEDGWQRVSELQAIAEASALEAMRLAGELDRHDAWTTARGAQGAAREANRFLHERNRAYTFHGDPGFSFGEGWYLAAAALLSDATIQIEPERPHTHQVEQFLRDAGLAARIVPYRPRPVANKPLPEMVARSFRADPPGSLRTIRAAFLGDGAIPRAIVDWADRTLAGAPSGRKVLLWVRHAAYQSMRNTALPELLELARRATDEGLTPIVIGDALGAGELPRGAVDMTLFWKRPLFQGADARRAQLQLFEHLKSAHALIGQLGVTTAGMDGPALTGLPTLYLTDAPNVRLGRWVGAIPGYQELLRGVGYLERVSETLGRWASNGRPA